MVYKENRRIDTQYKSHLKKILKRGRFTKHPVQPVRRQVLLTLPPMVFDLSNGIPIVTERYMPFAKTLTPISEMIAIINGVRTGQEMENTWGVKYWRMWTTAEKCAKFGLPPGDMGDGSYGPGFYEGGFNQFEHLVREIKENPYLSTHKISPWHAKYCLQHSELQRKVVVAPCHGDIQITIIGDKLTLRMDQRSGDYPVGVPADMLMYSALTLMMAQVTGFEPETFIHSVHDAHIYEDQIPQVKELVARPSYPFPLLHLTEEGKRVKSIFDFRREHFVLTDYVHGEKLNIPVTE